MSLHVARPFRSWKATTNAWPASVLGGTRREAKVARKTPTSPEVPHQCSPDNLVNIVARRTKLGRKPGAPWADRFPVDHILTAFANSVSPHSYKGRMKSD